MDLRSFIEGFFDGVGGESPMTLQSEFRNEFVGLNVVPIPENISDFENHGQPTFPLLREKISSTEVSEDK